ncbi:MAG TPA: hypothetical protein DDZ80_32660 [Cyanobacteria bacterium UBA8803]|nr:hypothetical protein [Cyanobacteria bacterium UBA9273]HBL62951.1 hypothetical protein [Cyanobacteria bacterium UBA8803]
MSDSIECPKCGKKTVVQRQNDVYQCLSCDFKKDFSQPAKPKSDNKFLWVSIITFIVALFLLGATDNTPNTTQFEHLSSPVPEPVQPTRN